MCNVDISNSALRNYMQSLLLRNTQEALFSKLDNWLCSGCILGMKWIRDVVVCKFEDLANLPKIRKQGPHNATFLRFHHPSRSFPDVLGRLQDSEKYMIELQVGI
jgi:hypothetical protein